jgi:hypothetical protein
MIKLTDRDLIPYTSQMQMTSCTSGSLVSRNNDFSMSRCFSIPFLAKAIEHLEKLECLEKQLDRMRIDNVMDSLQIPRQISSVFSCNGSSIISNSLQQKLDDIVSLIDSLSIPSGASHLLPSKKLNGDEIAETLQAEASFTIATDKKPIVATYGCGPCVALGGYDAINKIAFIVHFSNAGEVRNCGHLIFYNISKLIKQKITIPIQIHLRGGWQGKSEPIIEAIKRWMKGREDLPMEIASEDILCKPYSGSKSLSIDSRNGQVADYNCLSNPKSRDITQLNVLLAIHSAYNPKITVAYAPK